MSEAKFTPAPWVIIKQDDYEAIDNDELNLNVCTFTSRADDASHDQALIAAAPEMYELLESIVVNEMMTGDDAFSEQINELLAKARGEKC